MKGKKFVQMSVCACDCVQEWAWVGRSRASGLPSSPSHSSGSTKSEPELSMYVEPLHLFKPPRDNSKFNIVVESSLFFQYCKQTFCFGHDHHGAERDVLLCLVFSPDH